MDFNFQYRITYESGQFYVRPHQLIVQISKEEYRKILQGVIDGTPINQIKDIPEVIAKMTEIVQYADCWVNMNGSQRTTPLKKPRAITDLDFFLPETEYQKINKMENLMEVFDRPEEHMTIYRNDGSSVTISSENGKVKVRDLRAKGTTTIREADYFLSLIS